MHDSCVHTDKYNAAIWSARLCALVCYRRKKNAAATIRPLVIYSCRAFSAFRDDRQLRKFVFTFLQSAVHWQRKLLRETCARIARDFRSVQANRFTLEIPNFARELIKDRYYTMRIRAPGWNSGYFDSIIGLICNMIFDYAACVVAPISHSIYICSWRYSTYIYIGTVCAVPISKQRKQVSAKFCCRGAEFYVQLRKFSVNQSVFPGICCAFEFCVYLKIKFWFHGDFFSWLRKFLVD